MWKENSNWLNLRNSFKQRTICFMYLENIDWIDQRTEQNRIKSIDRKAGNISDSWKSEFLHKQKFSIHLSKYLSFLSFYESKLNQLNEWTEISHHSQQSTNVCLIQLSSVPALDSNPNPGAAHISLLLPISWLDEVVILLLLADAHLKLFFVLFA